MKNRIKELMKARGLSRDDLAEAIGAHPVTLSKLMSGARRLNSDWIEKIAAALQVAPEALFAAVPALRTVTVRGRVEAGAWAESFEWPEDMWYDVAIPNDPDLHGQALFGLETRGPSMNRRYPEGTVVVVTDQADLKVGRRYVIEREKPDGTFEATVKRLWQDESGARWLVPESDDPRHQQPIAIGGDDGETVRVRGRVVYSVQKED